MTTAGVIRDLKENPVVLAVAIGLHVVILVLLSVSLTSSEVPKNSAPPRSTVKAVVVDEKKVQTEIKKLEEKENKDLKKKLAEQKKLKNEAEKARKQVETEKKKLAELKKKQAEEKKKAELEKKQVAEKLKREKEAEKRRQLEEEELKRRLAEEERLAAENNDRLQSLRAQYVKLIEQKVERNWLRPANSTADMSCEVIVTQTSLGDVMSVSLKSCSEDSVFQRSVERAVRKASPLPPPPDPEVFDREIHFTFRPRT